MSDTNVRDDDEVVIVDDAAPAVDKTKKPATADTNVATEADLATLKAQLAESASREKALSEKVTTEASRADEAATAIQRITQDKFYAQEVAVANALANAQNEAEAITADIGRLQAEGKLVEAAQLIRKLTRAEGAASEAEKQKGYIESQKAQFTAAIKRQQAEAEARANAPQQQIIPPKSAAWIAAHPRFNSDMAYRNAALWADDVARRKGIQPESDEYFEFIETQLGERTPVESDAPRTQSRSTSSAAAPSRSTPAATGGRTQRMTLSAAEKEMADLSMRHITDPSQRYLRYWQNKQQMLQNNPLVTQ